MAVERLSMKNIKISDFIKEEFLSELKKLDPEMDIISLVCIAKKKNVFPIVFNHENANELNSKKIHITSLDEVNLNKITKLLEKKYGAKQ